MASEKPLILLSNDDGYQSPGLLELAATLIDSYEVLVVAPKNHHSGTGRGIPFGASYSGEGTIDIHTVQLTAEKNINVYSVEGTPALSVAHAVLEVAPRKPDLCISGINFGENVGKGLHYSGTIGAAMEAASFGIVSMAVSQEMRLDDIIAFEGQRSDFTIASKITKRIVNKILSSEVNQNFFCLNVNIPFRCDVDVEWKLANQSRVDRWRWVKPDMRDFSKPFELNCENEEDSLWEPDSDSYVLLKEKKVSIMPLTFSMQAKDGEYSEESLKQIIE